MKQTGEPQRINSSIGSHTSQLIQNTAFIMNKLPIPTKKIGKKSKKAYKKRKAADNIYLKVD